MLPKVSKSYWSYLCVLACLLAAGCAAERDLVRRSQRLMGTHVVISAHGPNANEAISAAFEEVRRVDGIMSLHRADSELSRVNERAVKRLSEDLYQVLTKAQEISAMTDGSFDVTIRPLAEAWGFIDKEYRTPSQAELTVALSKVGYRSVQIEPVGRSIKLLRQGASIDLGGIAKGYAVDRAIEKLRGMGITNAMVRAGGDLRVMGEWPVQIEDSKKRAERTTIPLKDAAVSTSGNYEKYFVVDGKRYAHILNPRTGMPVEGVASCTVIAATCMESDALATALFVYGPERTAKRFGKTVDVRFTLAEPAAQPDSARDR